MSQTTTSPPAVKSGPSAQDRSCASGVKKWRGKREE